MAGGRIQADLGLQIGAEKRADVVVVVEALQRIERRYQHGTYNLVLNMMNLAVYVRKEFSRKNRAASRFSLREK